MRKKLSIIFAIAGLLGCAYLPFSGSDCDGCGPDYGLVPFYYGSDEKFAYVNNSGLDMKLSMIGDCTEDYNFLQCEQEIENSDALNGHHWVIPNGYKRNCDFIEPYISSDCLKSIYFKMEFLSEPKVCLLFDGDAEVRGSDIRYSNNYYPIDIETPTIYFYTITPDLMQWAKEEHCGE